MTPQEMQARSSEKVKQIMGLMTSLHLRVEARERISQEGFIEKTIFWIDDENYPSAAPTGATAEAPVQEKAAPVAQEEVAEMTEEERAMADEDDAADAAYAAAIAKAAA